MIRTDVVVVMLSRATQKPSYRGGVVRWGTNTLRKTARVYRAV